MRVLGQIKTHRCQHAVLRPYVGRVLGGPLAFAQKSLEKQVGVHLPA